MRLLSSPRHVHSSCLPPAVFLGFVLLARDLYPISRRQVSTPKQKLVGVSDCTNYRIVVSRDVKRRKQPGFLQPLLPGYVQRTSRDGSTSIRFVLLPPCWTDSRVSHCRVECVGLHIERVPFANMSTPLCREDVEHVVCSPAPKSSHGAGLSSTLTHEFL